jgi:hypothetical protein
MKLDLEVGAAGPASKTSERRPSPATGHRQRGDGGSSSWWTARAKAGEVSAGFSKDEILRRTERNPRIEGGMFDRIQGVLRALGSQ